MNATPLNLKPDSATAPTISLTLQLIKEAIKLKAEAIRLELDMELHLKVHEEMKAINQDKSQTVDELFFKISRLPKAFGVTFTINGVQNQMPSASGELFGNVTRILLLAVGIPVWTKGEISAQLETINPASKWILESKDLTRRIELRRIRKTG
jgi:hypothetical protein